MNPQEVAAVERLEFRAFPPAEQFEFGGWTLRATEQATSRRVNSATSPLGSPADMAGDLGHIESFYRDRNQDPIIRVLSPSPSAIDDAVAKRGYTHEAETFVMVAELDAGSQSDAVTVHADPPGEWVGAKQLWVGMTDAQVASWRRRAAAIPGTVGYVVLGPSGAPHAIGLGVIEEGWLGVFDVNTDPDHLRAGHASVLMRGMLAWAAGQGATRSYLQVQGDNAPALGLYRGLGYVEAYRYWYRRKPSGPVG